MTDDRIAFGISTPLSGGVAPVGLDGLAGMRAWASDVNTDGGVQGRQIEIVEQDDESNPQKTVTNIEYLAGRENVFAIWGNVGTGTTVAAMPVVTELEIPLLFPYALARQISDPVNPYVFALAPSAYTQLHAWSDWLAEQPDSADRRYGILTTNTSEGTEVPDGFNQGASADQLVATETFDLQDASVKPQILNLDAAGATDVYVHGNHSHMAKFLKEAEELGVEFGTVTGSSAAVTDQIFELAGDSAEGHMGLATTDFTTPEFEEFSATLAEQAPDANASAASFMGWTGGRLIVEALNSVEGCLTRPAFLEALESIENFESGGLGTISFSATDHLGGESTKVSRVEGGEWTAVTDWITPTS